MSKFIYHNSVPGDIRPLIEEYLEPLGWMVPRWCQHVNVLWNQSYGDEVDNESTGMATSVVFQYRFAEITVYPLWLEVRPDIKKDNAIHEMIHLHTSPMFNYAMDTVEMLLKDNEQFRAHVQEGLRSYNEGAVQDLTDTIFQRLM